MFKCTYRRCSEAVTPEAFRSTIVRRIKGPSAIRTIPSNHQPVPSSHEPEPNRPDSSVIRPVESQRPFQNLKEEMQARKLPLLYDDLTPSQQHKLEQTLQSFLPRSWTSQSPLGPLAKFDRILHPGHHLVYFNPAMPAGKLLPDGTDPLQSPGPPFVRRMWAGGTMKFNRWFRNGQGVKLATRREIAQYVCHEFIRDVTMSSNGNIIVGIERRFGPVNSLLQGLPGYRLNSIEWESLVRRKLWHEEADAIGYEGERDETTALVETRKIVFMKERTEREMEAIRKGHEPARRAIKSKYTPDFSYTLTPTPSLLFRYSALTFNAHAIHLDPGYSRDIEGHRNLLVHGPLTLTLLLTLLRQHLIALQPASPDVIHSFEYKNLRPLYCNEPMTLCIAKGDPENREWHLWIEDSEGSVAVRGTAVTRKPVEISSGERLRRYLRGGHVGGA